MRSERFLEFRIPGAQSDIAVAPDKESVCSNSIQSNGVGAGKVDLDKTVIAQCDAGPSSRISRKTRGSLTANRIKTRRAIRREGEGCKIQIVIIFGEPLREIIRLADAQLQLTRMANAAARIG